MTDEFKETGDVQIPPDSLEPEGVRTDSVSTEHPKGLDLVNGPVFKTTLLLAGPVVASHLLNLALGIADLKMVGYLGTESQAALVLSGSLIMFLMAIALGTGFATITYVSQHTGGGNHHLARRSAAHALLLGVILGGIIALISYFLLPEIIGLFKFETDVEAKALAYSQILLSFASFFFLLFMGISIMQGLGDTVTPLILMAFINLLNILLNYLLIFGAYGFPEMGIQGAATGTVIARATGTLVIFGLLISGKYRMRLGLKDFRPIPVEFWNLLRLGVPNSMQAFLRNTNVLFLYKILSLTYLPTIAITSLGVGFHAEALAFVPLIGLFIATGAMVGQNLGAKQPERAEQAAWSSLIIAFCLMLVACIAFLTVPHHIIGFFSDDPAVIRTGSVYLRINAITQIFQSAIVLIGALRGAGDSISPLLAHITGNWLIRLPLAYYLALYTGLQEWGVWIAMATSSAIECSIYFWLFRRGKWKTMRLTSDKDTGQDA